MTGYGKKLALILALVLALAFSGGAAFAKDDKVRFVYVGWTCVTTKTDVATAILKSLGYDAQALLVSVPIAYEAMSSNEADVFLGNWMPSMKTIADAYFERGTVVQYTPIMPGAKYTLAVPAYAWEGGLKHFDDIAKFGDKLGWKIYGIEEGNDGNEIIQAMIDADMHGLGRFELVPSSEPAMLGQVQSFARNGQWIVFLGWSPHSMNENIDMKYLDGSTAETFGENDGTAVVYTNIRAGFAEEQPNVARFLKNYRVPVEMINQIMVTLHDNAGLEPIEAAAAWLKENPELYREWLNGVTTADGRPALPVWEKALADM
ncbi:MAG TPA: glycine/betaine ABC transporter substrate-binding protein [Phycisphaerales bacterium]|nr:glycine/betaine ABC transporter substrate-binding protein [Phycisphaerales bacterium]